MNYRSVFLAMVCLGEANDNNNNNNNNMSLFVVAHMSACDLLDGEILRSRWWELSTRAATPISRVSLRRFVQNLIDSLSG